MCGRPLPAWVVEADVPGAVALAAVVLGAVLLGAAGLDEAALGAGVIRVVGADGPAFTVTEATVDSARDRVTSWSPAARADTSRDPEPLASVIKVPTLVPSTATS